MKPDKHTLLSLTALAIAAALSGLTWGGVLQSIRAMEADTAARAAAALEGEAAGLAAGLSGQIQALDQQLRFMAAAWQTDPARFDIAYWQHQTGIPDARAETVFLADRNGLVRQATLAGITGQNVAGMDCFRALSDASAPDDRP
ncbi:MAG TPA: hypothetical protein VE690_13600 [Rhodopila sp.]|nr:hypothetical protein [Rhodopila sp.]